MPLPPRIARQIERPLWGPLLAYAVAQAFFLYTIAPTLLWGDDAKFQWMAYLRDTRAGAAYDHRFWVILAHPFTRLPVGDVAFRATLWTSIWAAVAVALVYAVLRRLTSSGWAAAVGAATLMVSHTFWTHAVRAEVYSLVLRGGTEGPGARGRVDRRLYGLGAPPLPPTGRGAPEGRAGRPRAARPPGAVRARRSSLAPGVRGAPRAWTYYDRRGLETAFRVVPAGTV